jgi:hypothetical protein
LDYSLFVQGHIMKKAFLLSSALVSASAVAAPNPSFSEIRLGFERIDYSEKLDNVAGITDLEQSASVTNPAIRQLSYTGIDDDWGFYIGSAATIATSIDTEVWNAKEFGNVQQNDFKIKANEIALSMAYNLTRATQVTFGARIHTSSFTRSSFKLGPAANSFDEALKALGEGDELPRFDLPGQRKDSADVLADNPSYLAPVISITEDQMGILGAVGIRYDSRLADAFNDVSWYAETEVSTPFYSRTQNTSIESVTLTDSFNGWGVMARAGVRYQLKEHIALMVGVDAQYKERDKISEEIDGRRRTVPNIKFENVSFSAGLQWSY